MKQLDDQSYPYFEECDADDDRVNGIGPGMESEFDEEFLKDVEK